MKDAEYWVDKLGMQPHPEGGYFCEVYRSHERVAESALPQRYGGSRSFSTSIYFLLKAGQFSRLHRLQSDELWHFYTGSPLKIHLFQPDGRYTCEKLGSNPEEGESFQVLAPLGTWFGGDSLESESYSLVGCTVAPGFDFEDFELAEREVIQELYPEHRELIQRLTLRR